MLNKVFTDNSFKSTLKIIGEFECALGIILKAICEQDLMKAIWIFLEVGDIEFWELYLGANKKSIYKVQMKILKNKIKKKKKKKEINK